MMGWLAVSEKILFKVLLAMESVKYGLVGDSSLYAKRANKRKCLEWNGALVASLCVDSCRSKMLVFSFGSKAILSQVLRSYGSRLVAPK